MSNIDYCIGDPEIARCSHLHRRMTSKAALRSRGMSAVDAQVPRSFFWHMPCPIEDYRRGPEERAKPKRSSRFFNRMVCGVARAASLEQRDCPYQREASRKIQSVSPVGNGLVGSGKRV